MADKRKLFSRVQGEKRVEDVLHSSGFAQVQNGNNIGASSGESFAERRAIDEHRRFVKGYENARLVRSAYTAERARTYVPRTHSKFADGARRLGSRRDTSGDGFHGSMINSGADRPAGCRRMDTPSVMPSSASTPKNPAFRPDFKPKFR